MRSLLQRNRVCLDALVDVLLEHERVEGDEIRSVVEENAADEDLVKRAEAAEVALL